MYVGRIVAVGRNEAGRNAVLYRVSSRSFPNRRAVDNGGTLAIMPREGSEADLQKNPYIAYNALRIAGEWAVAANGSHTDLIADRIAGGTPIREALALCLSAMDYEKDDHDTPRIAAVVPRDGPSAWLATVRRDALVVKQVSLIAGRALYLATYEDNDVDDRQSSAFDASTGAEAAAFVITGGAFAAFESPVTGAAAVATASGFSLGTYLVE